MEILKKYQQEHLLDYMDELSELQKNQLIDQIKAIDFELIQKIYQNRNGINETKKSELKPIVPIELNDNESDRLFNVGLNIIKKGEVAVVLMAGGQGTRLGHEGPKGTYDIGLPSKKSLFAIQCDKLLRLYDLTGQYVRWYIMTSEDNHDETIQHFTDHEYFGYEANSIVFFKQDRLPLILENGKIAMSSKYEINLAANGNGGVFSSLKSNNLLNDMNQHGVKQVFLYGVDNVLAKVADPIFVAFAKESKQDIASKAVNKISPDEKVGLMCYKNNLPGIVEYSEISDTLRNKRNDDGQLTFRNANILSHIFTLDFLTECSNRNIPYHAAYKKVNFLHNGEMVKADSENGYKFELFMFDVFQYAKDMPVLTVKREEEFAPVKNKEGNDSPESARRYIYDLHKKWLKNVNIDSPDDYEIDSRLTYMGEGLKNYKLQSS